MRINKADIVECIFYSWICPECYIENIDRIDPDEVEYYHCENCKIDIELQEG